jgi:hypothetical protein
LFFLSSDVLYFSLCYIDRADEEEVEPEAHGPANTSTSNTLVLSEDLRVERETSPPHEADPKTVSPVPSPQAPKKKKAKIGAGKDKEVAAGSVPNPLLGDVSCLLLPSLIKRLSTAVLFFCVVAFCSL